MEGKRRFWLLYRIILLIFVSAAAALSARVAELRRGALFYEQAAREREFGSADSPAQPVSPAQPGTTKRPAAEKQGRRDGTAAWLRIEGTPVDYPVMLGADNQYYLNHLPDGTENALGSLFLDSRCTVDSPHLIIYGHNGLGGRMFGSLKQYESREYYAKHPSLTLEIAGVMRQCPIFSVRRVAADSDAYTLDFETPDALCDYVKQAAAQALYPISVNPDGAGRVLTLSTCAGAGGQRLIVQAYL